MRHGLAATVVAAIEDVEEFERFEAGIRADYQAVSMIEYELVARLASLLWRIRRATLIETNLFQLQARQARVGSGTANPGLENLYRLLRIPETFGPSQAGSNKPELTNHRTNIPNARGNSSSYPNPATIFLRLCNLRSFPIKRINRYEAALWRQVAQTLFILDAGKKRLPFPTPVAR
jgi:hypothetical protein